jgi:ribosomal protein L7Ae-like RNA K-turn-binding protein
MITLGEEFVLKEIAVKQGLVFLATDAGENIKKKLRNKTKTYNTMLLEEFTSTELSNAIGKVNRRVVLVTDKGFIKKFMEYINS